MTGLTPNITDAEVVQHGRLRLTFSDGLTGEVDVLDRMWGPVSSRHERPRASRRSRSTPKPAQSFGLVEPISRRTRSMSESAPASGRTGTSLPERTIHPLGIAPRRSVHAA